MLTICVFADQRIEDLTALINSIEYAFNNPDETERVREQLFTEMTNRKPSFSDYGKLKMSFMLHAIKKNKPNDFKPDLPPELKAEELENYAETQ